MSRQVGKASQHRTGEGTENQGDPCPLVQTVALTRDYPGIRALDNVDFSLRAGEVHVLFGENGAGKSTLISMLAGATRPTSGQILFRGRAVEFDNVHAARNLGISAVFQEFSLIPQMTVAENMFLGAEERRRGLLHSGTQTKKAQAVLDSLDFHLDPGERVDRLSRAEQQMVEIAKLAGSRCASSLLTSMLCAIERPRSPRSTPRIHFRYCTMTGWSSPNWRRRPCNSYSDTVDPWFSS